MKRKRLLRGLAVAAVCLVLLFIVLIIVASASPMLAAQGADVLRAVLGDKIVSYMEMALFQVQDTLLKWRYSFGGVTPAAPWPTSTSQATLLAPDIPQVPATPTPASAAIDPPSASNSSTPAPVIWQPGVVTPLGSVAGEGAWAAYIQDAQGRTVAYRTFVVPDPTRPYAVVGIVAFDMNLARLHFILGSKEPYSPDSPPRSGEVPAADKVPGVLLAMFNGGFKARHGHFGAMADGIVALPPRDGYATLAIYQDGSLRMGEWGTEILPSADMVAWRQNGPLVIHNDQVNPDINKNLPQEWGYTVDDVSPTWRSGLSLSQDGKALYYFVGPSLSMEALAKAMLAVQGADNGMQLDINTYWVHFVAVRPDGDKLKLEALFPDMMNENIDRYLQPYTRDYFYVTSVK